MTVNYEFLIKLLASSPSTDKVDRNVCFTINMTFDYQLKMNFSQAVPSEDFIRQLTNYGPSFSITLNIFLSYPTGNLESLAAKANLLKEIMQQMKHSYQTFLQREQGFNKL